MEQNMKTLGVILATLAMIASVLVMPVASAEEGDLQATISGHEGSTSFASENGTAVFTVDISSITEAAHNNLAIAVILNGTAGTLPGHLASVDDCSGGAVSNLSAGAGESSSACITVGLSHQELVGSSIDVSVSVTSDEDTSGTSVNGLIKISNWMVSSADGVQSYSENETHDYTITVTNLMLDAEGAGMNLNGPVYITLVEIGGGWNVDSVSSAWDKPSLTATINYIPANGSVDLVLQIQLVGQIVTSSSYTGAPASIGFNAFDEYKTPFTTFIFLQAEIATFNGVGITSSSDETDAWDPSTTEVDNGCTGLDAGIGWDITILNFGNDRDTFDVVFDTADIGSWTVNGVDSFTTSLLEPKANDGIHTTFVDIVVPAGLAAGTTHSFSMTATSNVDNSISKTQTFSVTVAQCYDFDMTVDSMMNSANPGSSTDFTITISNAGNGDDTFTYVIMTGPTAWNPSLAALETEVASDATGQNVLTVTVPADASSIAVSGNIMVHAYSEICGDELMSCDVESSITVSVSANSVFDLTAGYFTNDTGVAKSSTSVEEGMSVQMKVNVTNNGNGDDQITLSIDENAPSWITISDEPILVGPGLTETVIITIAAPASGSLGDHTFQVTATSSDNTVTSTTNDLTVTITEKGTGSGPTTDDVEEDDSPGFGALSAIAVLGAVLLLRRRS